MRAVRLRRLQSDFARLTELTRRHPRIALVQAAGTPPDRYQLRYTVRCARNKNGMIEFVTEHLVEIALPAAYPRTPPLCRMLTPVFHPNIAPHAICIGDHWSPGETLSSLVVRIAEMLAYQSYNTKSPLNGEAAKWVEQNLTQLPLDPAHMSIEDLADSPEATADSASASAQAAGGVASGPEAPGVARRPAPAGPPVTIAPTPPAPPPIPSPPASAPPAVEAKIHDLLCESCGAALRIRQSGTAAMRVRCPKCRNLMTFHP